MRLVKSVRRMQAISNRLRCSGKRIGFVPTMGALHEGHLSLIRAAKKKCGVVVVSVYVNPTQFAPGEDFSRYPRDLKADLRLCRALGVDFVFAPSDDEMYGDGFQSFVVVDELTRELEGACRPTHFKGVATVVAKLFNIVKPHAAFFGCKDYQQALVVKRMCTDLNFDVKIVVCPTVREPDGLALSSRNSYLSQRERNAALVLFKCLKLAEGLITAGERNPREIERAMLELLTSEPLAKPDYVAVRDAATLKRVKRVHGRVVVLLAVRIGSTRLIDNCVVDCK